MCLHLIFVSSYDNVSLNAASFNYDVPLIPPCKRPLLPCSCLWALPPQCLATRFCHCVWWSSILILHRLPLCTILSFFHSRWNFQANAVVPQMWANFRFSIPTPSLIFKGQIALNSLYRSSLFSPDTCIEIFDEGIASNSFHSLLFSLGLLFCTKRSFTSLHDEFCDRKGVHARINTGQEKMQTIHKTQNATIKQRTQQVGGHNSCNCSVCVMLCWRYHSLFLGVGSLRRKKPCLV